METSCLFEILDSENIKMKNAQGPNFNYIIVFAVYLPFSTEFVDRTFKIVQKVVPVDMINFTTLHL